MTGPDDTLYSPERATLAVWRVYSGAIATCPVHRIVVTSAARDHSEAKAVAIARKAGFPAVDAERVSVLQHDPDELGYSGGWCESKEYEG